MTISMIIPAYCVNQELVDMTAGLVSSLDQERPDQTILVDNASTFPLIAPDWVTIFRTEQNQGYVGGVNVGLEVATGDVLYVINNDMSFSPGWRKALEDTFAAGYDVAVLHASDAAKGRGIEPGTYTTNNYAISRKVFNVLGPLDPHFWAAWGDSDYGRRIKEAHFTIGLNNDYTVSHGGSKTFRALGDANVVTRFNAGQERYRRKWGDVN